MCVSAAAQRGAVRLQPVRAHKQCRSRTEWSRAEQATKSRVRSCGRADRRDRQAPSQLGRLFVTRVGENNLMTLALFERSKMDAVDPPRGYQAELSAGEDGDCLRSYLHCCRKLRTASAEPRAGNRYGGWIAVEDHFDLLLRVSDHGHQPDRPNERVAERPRRSGHLGRAARYTGNLVSVDDQAIRCGHLVRDVDLCGRWRIVKAKLKGPAPALPLMHVASKCAPFGSPEAASSDTAPMSVTPVSSPRTAQSACANPQTAQSIAASAAIPRRSRNPGRFHDEVRWGLDPMRHHWRWSNGSFALDHCFEACHGSAKLVHHPAERRMLPVLDLDPAIRAAGAVHALAMFRRP